MFRVDYQPAWEQRARSSSSGTDRTKRTQLRIPTWVRSAMMVTGILLIILAFLIRDSALRILLALAAFTLFTLALWRSRRPRSFEVISDERALRLRLPAGLYQMRSYPWSSITHIRLGITSLTLTLSNGKKRTLWMGWLAYKDWIELRNFIVLEAYLHQVPFLRIYPKS